MPNDTKALFRRCQANKELNKLEDALMDAKRLLSIEPINKPGIELMQQLTRVIQDKVRQRPTPIIPEASPLTSRF